MKNDPGKVVAVIGDCALTGGMAFEALNNAGALRRDLIVVLNDNAMSISQTVGALSEWLSRKLTGGVMTRWRRRVRTVLDAFDDVGRDAIRLIERGMETTKVLLDAGDPLRGPGLRVRRPHRRPRHPRAGRYVPRRPPRGRPDPGPRGDDQGQGLRAGRAGGAALPRRRPLRPAAPGRRGAGARPSQLHAGLRPRPSVELAEADPRVVAITAAMLDGHGARGGGRALPRRASTTWASPRSTP